MRRSKEEVQRIKDLCNKHGIIYETLCYRLKIGFTEEEAVNGVKKTCKSCGREFLTFELKKAYCCEECRYQAILKQKRDYKKRKKALDYDKDIEGGGEDLVAIYNRPLTPDTKYLVNLWHSQGDSVEEIAYILRRPKQVIQELLV